jgi:hypothetical protein
MSQRIVFFAVAGSLAVCLAACQSDTYELSAAAAAEEAPPAAKPADKAPAPADDGEIPELPDPGPAPREVWQYAMTPTPSDEDVAKMLIVWAESDVDSGAAPLTVKFSCEPLEDGVKSPSYEWDFGDGSPKEKGEAPTHTYAKPGKYIARVVVTDADGNRGTDEVDIEVETD